MPDWSLDDELQFWREAHENAKTKGGALVAWGIYAGLRIAKDGSLDDAHKEMAGQLFELRQAVAAERERCAKIAEIFTIELINGEAVRFVAARIAAAIRKGE